jgi:hypothetical protein
MVMATDTRAVGQAAALAIGATVALEALFGMDQRVFRERTGGGAASGYNVGRTVRPFGSLSVISFRTRERTWKE